MLDSRRKLAEQRWTERDPGYHLSHDVGLADAPCDPAAQTTDRDNQHHREQELDDKESTAVPEFA